MQSFVTVARIVKVRGLRGEVAAEILTDFPDRFRKLKKVYLQSDHFTGWLELQTHWLHKDRVILKFHGRDRPEEVQELVGCAVQIPEEERIVPPADAFYDSDLVGCRVFEKGQLLGEVVEIFKVGSEVGNLVVKTPEGSEFMLPLVRQFVLTIDLEAQKLEVQLPAGLLE